MWDSLNAPAEWKKNHINYTNAWKRERNNHWKKILLAKTKRMLVCVFECCFVGNWVNLKPMQCMRIFVWVFDDERVGVFQTCIFFSTTSLFFCLNRKTNDGRINKNCIHRVPQHSIHLQPLTFFLLLFEIHTTNGDGTQNKRQIKFNFRLIDTHSRIFSD